MRDEIITEVWRTRDGLAERYGHDLDAIVAAMPARERRPLTRVCRIRRPNQTLQGTATRRP